MKKLECDYCKGDLSTTGNCVDYRLQLSAQRIPSCGAYITDVMIYAPIHEDHHFCGFKCLKKWMDNVKT